MPELDELLANLESRDRTIIKKTLEQLGDLGNEKAVPNLLKMLHSNLDEDMLESILWTISRIGTSQTLIELLNDPNETIVIEVLDALGRREAREYVDAILPFLKHQNGEVRAIATWALGKIHAEKTYEKIINLLKTDGDPLVRANAAWAIGKFEKINSISTLEQIKDQESDECVLYNLNEAIEHLQEPKDPWTLGLKATIYECPQRETPCAQKLVQIETRSDDFIKIEIVQCDSCPIAKICQINLIRKINQ